MPTALYPQRSSLAPCFFQDLSCASVTLGPCISKHFIGHCIAPTPGTWLKETGAHEGLELSPESDPQHHTAPTSTLALPSIVLEAPVTGALLPKVDSGMNKRMEKQSFCEQIKKNAICTKSEHIRAAQSGGERESRRETMRQSLGLHRGNAQSSAGLQIDWHSPIPAPPPPTFFIFLILPLQSGLSERGQKRRWNSHQRARTHGEEIRALGSHVLKVAGPPRLSGSSAGQGWGRSGPRLLICQMPNSRRSASFRRSKRPPAGLCAGAGP